MVVCFGFPERAKSPGKGFLPGFLRGPDRTQKYTVSRFRQSGKVLSACIRFLHSRLDSGAVPSDLATHLNWVYHIIHESMRRLDVISPMYLVRSTETMIRRIRAPCYLVILVVRSVEKTHSPRHFPSLLHTVRVLLSVKDHFPFKISMLKGKGSRKPRYIACGYPKRSLQINLFTS